MITRVEIDGYKSFDGFSLDLPSFAVLVGANASGKSNLLEAVDLLGHLIRNPKGQTLVDHARRGGPKELFRRGADGVPVDSMRLAARVLVHGEHGYCHLRVEARVTYADPPEPLRVETAVLNVHDHDGPDPDRTCPPLPPLNLAETGQLHCAEAPVQDAVYGRELAEASKNWLILEPSPKAMRVVASTYDTAPPCRGRQEPGGGPRAHRAGPGKLVRLPGRRRSTAPRPPGHYRGGQCRMGPVGRLAAA